MLVVGSTMAVAIHFACSSAMVVATFEHWVSTSEAAVVASRIEDAASALASTADSSVVA
jgi:hypothetical protein